MTGAIYLLLLMDQGMPYTHMREPLTGDVTELLLDGVVMP